MSLLLIWQTSPTAGSQTVSPSLLTTGHYRLSVLATSSLVEYWRLGEPSGSTVVAEVGDTGAYVNSPVLGATGLLAGDVDTAVTIAAAGQKTGQVNPATAMPTGATARTVIAWIRQSATVTDATLFSYGSQSTRQSFGLKAKNNGTFEVWTYGDDHAWASTNALDGATHMVAATYDGSTTIALYFDGSHVAGDFTLGGALNTTIDGNGVRLGVDYFQNANFMDGVLDEVSVWNRALSAAEITALYTAGTVPVAGIYAPTVTVGTATVSPGLISDTAVIYGPTVTPGSVTVSPGLISDTAIIYAPGFSQYVTPGLISDTAAIYAPTLAPGAVSVTPAAISDTALIYAPTVQPGSVTVSPGLISNTAQLFTPGLNQTVAPARIVDTAVIYSPQINLSTGIGLISDTALIYSPVLTVGSVTVSPGVIADTALIYSPVVAPAGVSVLPPLISDTALIYAPTLAVGAVTVTPGRIDDTAVIYAPGVTPPSSTVSPGAIVDTAVIYPPAVTVGSVTVTPPLIADAVSIFEPSVSIVSAEQTVSPPLISSGTAIYDLSISGGAVAVTPPSGRRPGLPLGAAKITGRAGARKPPRQVVRPGLIANGSRIYAPDISINDDELVLAILLSF